MLYVRERAVWGGVPAGFVRLEVERGWLVIRSDKIGSITPDACRLMTNEPSGFTGRAPLKSLALDGGDLALVRPYHHGGVLRAVQGTIFYSWPPRPFRELRVTEDVRARGIPTVESYAAYVEQVWGPFYRGWLVTRQLTGVEDLWQAMQSGFIQELGFDQTLSAIAAAVRALHREGVYHTDLNLKNILIGRESGKVTAYVIDFDKARLMSGRVPERLARRNVERLLRSINKLDPLRSRFSSQHWQTFLDCYRAS